MSETDNPYAAGSGSQPPSPSGSGTAGSATGSTGMKERVADTAAHTAEAGRDVAHEAREKARDVAREAADQARGLLERTRDELGSQAQSQQRWVAESLRAMEDELGRMARVSEDPGYVSDLARRAGEATGRAAGWLEDREPGDLLGELEDFARRRPGLFIALAAGAGLVVGRFLRGMRDATSRPNGGDDGAASGGREAPGFPPASPAMGTSGSVTTVPSDVQPGEPALPHVPGGPAGPASPPPVPPPAPTNLPPGGGTNV